MALSGSSAQGLVVALALVVVPALVIVIGLAIVIVIGLAFIIGFVPPSPSMMQSPTHQPVQIGKPGRSAATTHEPAQSQSLAGPWTGRIKQGHPS